MHVSVTCPGMKVPKVYIGDDNLFTSTYTLTYTNILILPRLRGMDLSCPHSPGSTIFPSPHLIPFAIFYRTTCTFTRQRDIFDTCKEITGDNLITSDNTIIPQQVQETLWTFVRKLPPQHHAHYAAYVQSMHTSKRQIPLWHRSTHATRHVLSAIRCSRGEGAGTGRSRRRPRASSVGSVVRDQRPQFHACLEASAAFTSVVEFPRSLFL
jgi:hypothetical protein